MGLTAAVREGLTGAVTRDTSYDVGADGWYSLHSADPGPTGANEITTGTGANARQQPTFSGSGGTDTNAGDVTFTVVPSVTARWVGAWTAQTGGTWLGGWPMAGEPLIACAQATEEAIVVPGHGLAVNDPVRLYTLDGTNASIPPEFTEDAIYYVVTVPGADSVVLSATISGGPIIPSVSGGFVVRFDESIASPSGGCEIVFPATTGIVYSTVSD